MRTDDTTKWIVALRNGQESALSHYFNLHGQSLIYFATKIIGEELEAEDIVAQVFYKAWERRDEYYSETHLKSSLYVSCRNACLNYLRGLKRKTTSQHEYFRQLEEGEDAILTEVIEVDVLEFLNREIEQLPEKMREIFRMIFLEGKKTIEVSLILGISVKTVRNQKAKAVGILKTAILKKGLSSAMSLAILLFLDN